MTVPAYHFAHWQVSHRQSPFGAKSIVRCGGYLGSSLHIRTNLGCGYFEAGAWHKSAAHAARLACWKKPLSNMEERGQATTAARASPSLRAIEHNTY
eukprot:2810560-Heterocapsa_arctica.AAC.1